MGRFLKIKTAQTIVWLYETAVRLDVVPEKDKLNVKILIILWNNRIKGLTNG